MSKNITIFVMRNDGSFEFIKCNPDYAKIISLLGLGFNDGYFDERYVSINGLRYTMYTRQCEYSNDSMITALNLEGTMTILNTFILARENKNHFFFDMTTENMNDIKKRLVFPTEKKRRLLANDYYFNKVILRFD